MSSLLATKAQAEWYAGVYGGIADPGAFSNATVSSPTLGGGVNAARVIDLELDNSGVFGAKAGYFFDTRPWLAFETEVFTLNPQVKEQTIVGGATPGKVFAEAFPATPLRVTPWVVNIIIRSPSMSDAFQPYGGMGYGLFFATSSKGGQSNTSINLGLNLFAGARYVLTPKTALFGEFKFNSSTIRFSDIKGDYESKSFVFGVMWHFNK